MTESAKKLLNEKVGKLSSDDQNANFIRKAINLTRVLTKCDANAQELSAALSAFKSELTLAQASDNGSNSSLRSLVNNLSKSLGQSMEWLIEREKRRNGVYDVNTEPNAPFLEHPVKTEEENWAQDSVEHVAALNNQEQVIVSEESLKIQAVKIECNDEELFDVSDHEDSIENNIVVDSSLPARLTETKTTTSERTSLRLLIKKDAKGALVCQEVSVKKQGPSRVVKKEEEDWDEPMEWSPSPNNEDDDDVSDYEELSDDDNDEDGENSMKTKKSEEFPCNVCGKVFKWIESLRHHELKHLPIGDPRRKAISARKFECSTCGKVLAGVGALSNHKKIHLENIEERKPHKCEECGKRFHTPAHLERHNRTHWPADDPRRRAFECDICGKFTSGSDDLKSHKKTHLDARDPEQAKLKNPFNCELCGDSFGTNSYFRRHTNDLHTEGINKDNAKYPHQCNVCEARFLYPPSLQRHQKGHLPKDDPRRHEFECFICLTKFTCKITLKDHRKIHLNENEEDRENNPFKCELCELTFGSVNKIRYHMDSHTGIAKFKCDICDSTFRDSHAMKKHMNMKKHIRMMKFAEKKNIENNLPMESNEMNKQSANGENDEDDSTDEEEDSKPFKCSLCPKRYKRNDHLKTHMKSHSKSENLRKPYKCGNCDKRFAQSGQLKIHEKNHLPADDPRRIEKKVKCDICGDMFKKRSLGAHKKTHLADDDPRKGKVECDECGLLLYAYRLKRHKETHLDEKDPVQAEMKRPFKCEFCGEGLRSKQCLDLHKKNIHTNNNDETKAKKGPYECNMCGHSFQKREKLEQHKRGHLVDGISLTIDEPQMKIEHDD